jgi:hypothetical protein
MFSGGSQLCVRCKIAPMSTGTAVSVAQEHSWWR